MGGVRSVGAVWRGVWVGAMLRRMRVGMAMRTVAMLGVTRVGGGGG